VTLAAALKVVEAISALVKWDDFPYSSFLISLGYGSTQFPAAWALIQIGDPAVPALAAEEGGDRHLFSYFQSVNSRPVTCSGPEPVQYSRAGADTRFSVCGSRNLDLESHRDRRLQQAAACASRGVAATLRRHKLNHCNTGMAA
jgi:hypothetical protein